MHNTNEKMKVELCWVGAASIIIKINDDSNSYDLTKLDEELVEFMAKQALLKQKMRKKRR